MRLSAALRTRTRGAFLLEALAALVVFALALLGVAASFGTAFRHAGSAQWRSEAVDIAAATLARMSVEDPVALPARYASDRGGDGYLAVLAQAMRLPGVTPTANAPTIEIVDAADSRRVVVTLQWQLPGDARANRASVAGVLPAP